MRRRPLRRLPLGSVAGRPRRVRRLREARGSRKGAVLPLAAFLMIVLIAMLAFSVDLGYISLVRGQMQNAADAGALAAASQLLDRDILKANPYQTSGMLAGDAEAQEFASANEAGKVSLTLGTSDVTYGHIENPKDPSSPLRQDVRPYNSAQVRVQRTEAQNGPLALFFARALGQGPMPLEASATATYEGDVNGFKFPGNDSSATCKLLPYVLAVTRSVDPHNPDDLGWDDAFSRGRDDYKYDPETGAVTLGQDGIREIKLFPTKTKPGNFGTIDIGPSNNSTNDIARQILDGPSRADLAAYPNGELKLGDDGTLVLEGDTGISAGVKDEFEQIIGQPRVIPLYSKVTGNGNNSEFTIVRFVGCVVVKVTLTGGTKELIIQPEHCVDRTAVTGDIEMKNSFVYKPLKLIR